MANVHKYYTHEMPEVASSGLPQDSSRGAAVNGVLRRISRHRKSSGHDVPLTEARMRSVLRRLKMSMAQYHEWTVGQPPKQSIADNPTRSARAWEVPALEYIAAMQETRPGNGEGQFLNGWRFGDGHGSLYPYIYDAPSNQQLI